MVVVLLLEVLVVVEWRRFFFFSPLLLCVFPCFPFCLCFSLVYAFSRPLFLLLCFFILSSLFSFLFPLFLFSPFLPKTPLYFPSLFNVPTLFFSFPINSSKHSFSLFFPFPFFFPVSFLSILCFFCSLTPKSSVRSSLFFSKSLSSQKLSPLSVLSFLFSFFFLPDPLVLLYLPIFISRGRGVTLSCPIMA